MDKAALLGGDQEKRAEMVRILDDAGLRIKVAL
jgi:hypothetical protein